MGHFVIVDKSEPLVTFGLGPCSALMMTIGNKKFMAHVDDICALKKIMVDSLKNEIRTQKAEPENVQVHLGFFPDTSGSFAHIQDILSELDIPEGSYEVTKTKKHEKIL